MMILEALYSFSVPPFHSEDFFLSKTFPFPYILISPEKRTNIQWDREKRWTLSKEKTQESSQSTSLCSLFSGIHDRKSRQRNQLLTTQCYQRIIKKWIPHQKKNQGKIRWNFDHFLLQQKRNILLLSITQVLHSICTQERNGQWVTLCQSRIQLSVHVSGKFFAIFFFLSSSQWHRLLGQQLHDTKRSFMTCLFFLLRQKPSGIKRR